jgi:hypothetical protein
VFIEEDPTQEHWSVGFPSDFGVVGHDGEYADMSNPTGAIIQLTRVLRSAQSGGFRKQIAVVDTCARFFEALQSSTDLPAGGLNPGPPNLKAFTGDEVVAHGGIALEEVMVPFVAITREGA